MSVPMKNGDFHAAIGAGHEQGSETGGDSCITCEAGDEFQMFWRLFSCIINKNMEAVVQISIFLEYGCMIFASEKRKLITCGKVCMKKQPKLGLTQHRCSSVFYHDCFFRQMYR